MKKTIFGIIAAVTMLSTVQGFASRTSPVFVKYATAIERILEIFETPEYKNGPLYTAYNRKVQYLSDKLVQDQENCNQYVDWKFNQAPADPDMYMDECLGLAGWTMSSGYRGTRPW